MTDPKPPLECTLCGLPIWNWTPTVWSPGPDRDPFCGDLCMGLASAVDHAIPPAIDRAIDRDHSLCGTEPCSDCR